MRGETFQTTRGLDILEVVLLGDAGSFNGIFDGIDATSGDVVRLDGRLWIFEPLENYAP